uniref:EGF-like domain-containing protein n=1 Tax=Syphacia muris TaxID=451379 RepID=A0A0N5AIZ0_9BILA
MGTRKSMYISLKLINFCILLVPPTEKPSENCLNGGIEVPFSNGTSMCICPAHYGGPKCEKLQCLNMGTPLDSRCGCISGFSGDFCEKRK